MTEALRVAKVSAQSLVLIWLVRRLSLSEPWHLPLCAVWTGNFRESQVLVWIIPQWMFIQCILAGTSVKISRPLHWCTSGIGTWTPSYFLFTPLPITCHADDTEFISPWWLHSPGSYSCMPQWQFSLDEGSSPLAKCFKKLISLYSQPIWLSYKILASNLVHLHWPQLKLHKTSLLVDLHSIM